MREERHTDDRSNHTTGNSAWTKERIRPTNRKISQERAHCSILIVDDEPGQLKLYSSLLHKAGFRVFEAASGSEALRIMNNTYIDLVVCDVFMPGLDGIEVLKEVRSLRTYPKSARIPLILITASTEIPREEARRADADALLSKMEKPETLIRNVDLVLERTPVNIASF